MSTTTSMSPAEDLDTVSSDTSYENRKYRQHQRRPTPSQNIPRSHSFSTIPRSPGDTLSYASASQTANGEFFVPTARPGSAYSAEVPVPSSYSVWGSDSSQHLYRKKQSDKRKACNTLLIATTTLVFLTVLAIAAVAAYLGVMTRNSDGDKYEIGFEGSLRIVHGDDYFPKLQDRSSVEFHKNVERYLRKIDTVYRKSPLGDSFRRCTIENFTNGSLIVHFIVYFDRRKFPVQVGETEASVRDVLVQEVMAVEPVAFKDVTIDIDSIQLKRHKKEQLSTKSSRLQTTEAEVPESNSVELELIHNLDVPEDIEETTFTTTSTTAAPPTTSFTVRTTTTRATTTSSTTTTTTTTTTTEEPTSTQVTLRVDFDRTPWRPVGIADTVLPEELIPELENRFLPGVLKQPVFDIEPVSEAELHPQLDSNFIRRVGIVVDEDPAGLENDTLVQNPVPGKEEGVEMPDKRADEEEQDEAAGEEEDYEYSEEGPTESPAVPQTTSTETPIEITTRKFSFLDWLSAQVANQKNSSASPSTPSGKAFTTTKPATRFFTFNDKNRPTAISYTAVQPITRPRPAPVNLTTPAPFAETTPSHLAAENPTTFVPKPFQIQAVLNVMSERTRTLSESPRSQKSLGGGEADLAPNSRTVPSLVDVPAIPDHFPPVRKPTSRPSNFKPVNDTAVSNLPIENLFTTAKPKNQSKTNSPVYTFKLGQGQNFHEVLSKVLADLAVGENPSSLKIDAGETETSSKNPDLNPWTNVPFRPAVLDALFSNKNKTKVATGNSVSGSSNENDIVRNVEIQVSTTTTTSPLLPGSTCNETSQFRCNNGDCISALSRCNQMRDCADNSDEVNCTCADFLRAQFLNRKICDGVVDCWDYSDENQCEWCSPDKYICTSSKKCINQTQICDGIRDCPVGDDEKHCVTIANDEEGADQSTYSNAGYVMVRREGRWGKLCMENFEPAMKKLRDNYQVADLGKAVCSALTFNELERIDRRVDTVPLGRASDVSFYYEIMESVINNDNVTMETARSSTIEYTPAKCPSKDVVHVTCKNLACGIRPRLSVSRARIVGGGNATPGAWPWQAALYKDGDFQCGATLINDRWLVSAGHCFYHSLDDYWVARLGALRRGSNLLSPFEQVRPVTHIIIHPSYVDAGFVNDISLLRMEEPVTFTDYVRPVCLPPPDTEIKDGRYCTVVGWGQLYETGRVFPDTLQEVQLPLVSTEECRKRTLFLPLYRLTNNMFCAGFDRGGRDACLGDSGGPLMCQEADSKWSIYGVTSNGYGCARANRPGVYTKVSQYVGWINSVVNGTYPHQKRKSLCNGHRCLLGECLPKSHVCNRITECSDGSDERDCA